MGVLLSPFIIVLLDVILLSKGYQDFHRLAGSSSGADDFFRHDSSRPYDFVNSERAPGPRHAAASSRDRPFNRQQQEVHHFYRTLEKLKTGQYGQHANLHVVSVIV